MQLDIDLLEHDSRLLLARMLSTALTNTQDNEYASWLSVSHLDWVELRNCDGDVIPREEYPREFHEYLPNITGSNTSYSVSTIPSRRQNQDGSFSDGVEICLGDIWNTRIVGDMKERFLTGTDSLIIDEKPRDSRILGWTLLKVEVTKDDDRKKIAHLYFKEHTDGETPKQFLARWGWSKRTPTTLP